MHVAVMGCVVNGPGESKLANIGISLPGTGETPVAPVYVDGEKTVTLKGERIAEEFQQIVARLRPRHLRRRGARRAPVAAAEDDRREGDRMTRAQMTGAPSRPPPRRRPARAPRRRRRCRRCAA